MLIGAILAFAFVAATIYERLNTIVALLREISEAQQKRPPA